MEQHPGECQKFGHKRISKRHHHLRQHLFDTWKCESWPFELATDPAGRLQCILVSRFVFRIRTQLNATDLQVYAIVDYGPDGHADAEVTVLSGLRAPDGIDVVDGALYVAEVTQISRFDNADAHVFAGQTISNTSGVVLLSGLPNAPGLSLRVALPALCIFSTVARFTDCKCPDCIIGFVTCRQQLTLMLHQYLINSNLGATVFLASQALLISPSRAADHNLHYMKMGPDGMLYFTLGSPAVSPPPLLS